MLPETYIGIFAPLAFFGAFAAVALWAFWYNRKELAEARRT